MKLSDVSFNLNAAKRIIICLFVFIGAGCSLAWAEELALWPVDPLVKVFPDTAPSDEWEAYAEVCRGEYATIQMAVRAESPITRLTATLSPLERRGGDGQLEARAPRFVGNVFVDRPTQSPSGDQLREPPADFPDVLLEVASVDVPAGQTQAIWLTIPIPAGAPEGVYRGELKVSGQMEGKAVTDDARVRVRVYPVELGPPRLWVTEWYSLHWPHMKIAPEPESDEYYALLGRYARNMAEHRHNVALISPLGLSEFSVGLDGGLAIDFARFDRWVQVFKDAGVIGRIEGGHIGGRMGDWNSPFGVSIRQVQDGKVTSARVDPTSPEADAFYAFFLPALIAHLKEKGWFECYLQHLADEPVNTNSESYRAMAALVRKYGPGLRIIEACHTKDLVGSMDVWVPQLNFFGDDYAHYQERQKAGEEVWFYTCVFPQGEYANRFIEQPLIKTRLLHWINFRYGATGYLHWGYNHWRGEDPFKNTTPPHSGPPYLPAGDAWIVYPGDDGPLDSIRFEAMRDGLDDYTLLSQLAERAPEKARAAAETLILDFKRYETDVRRFREVRHDVLEALSATR